MKASQRKWILIVGAVALGTGAAAGAWWLTQSSLPDGLAAGNGRIEAEEVDISTKYAGRVGSILVEEGDLIDAGQVLARMDTAELQAQRREAKARALAAVEGRDVAAAVIAQRRSECDLAEKEFRRAARLLDEMVEAESEVDVKRSRLETAKAACDAADAQLIEAEAAIEAAEARVALIEVQLDDAVLRSPVRGRVLYRLAEPGEILAGGGRVLTVLDLTDVYMETFLPSQEATQVSVGSDARIVLDAAPELVIPAAVSFVAPEAQFTPKHVETASERDKLMFRVKVRIPPEVIEPNIQIVKTGIRGVAYVQLAGPTQTAWPAFLETRLPSAGR